MRWYPVVQSECIVGLWVQLKNGWVVGPIVESSHRGVFVEFQGQRLELETVNVLSDKLIEDVGPYRQLMEHLIRQE